MAELVYNEKGRLLFTEEMKKEYTVLIPQMLPIHFELLVQIFRGHGYHMELLTTTGRQIVDEGLRNVHNDTCYPALLVIGQMLDALKSGKYDVHKTALMITQTGGGCRASNYINLLRKALKNNGMEFVPVISLNLSNMEKNPGFSFTPKLLYQLVSAICYGDLLMWAGNQCRPYEIHPGQTDRVIEHWVRQLVESNIGVLDFTSRARRILKDFESIPRRHEDRIRVGIVGEIYIKYAPLGNNELEKFLQSEGAEVVVPGLLDFIIFMCDHHIVDTQIYHVRYKKYLGSAALKKFLLSMQNKMIQVFSETSMRPPAAFEETKKMAAAYVSPANKMGEGWLLTAEMVELVHSGVENVVCAQPFGCLPNHIVGKGMIRKIRETNPNANIVSIDYDPGSTRVNQENRIKLMLSTAAEQKKNAKNADNGGASTF